MNSQNEELKIKVKKIEEIYQTKEEEQNEVFNETNNKLNDITNQFNDSQKKLNEIEQ